MQHSDGTAWVGHMRAGRFEDAWRCSDAVLAQRTGTPCAELPRHLQWVWDGSPLADRSVLVRCYHGLGDTLQFIRYAPLLRSLAREVTVWAQPRLLPLLATVAGIDRLLPLHDGEPDAPYEADVELMELPHVFRTTLATVPASVPYIHVQPAPRRPDGKLAVGLVWRAGDWDARRSVGPRLLRRLARVPGIRWEVHQQQADAPRHATLLEEARAIRALDLVISVDTMIAHLAGALGVPVWTLLHAQCDWRWMEHREDTPWYPTMRLFRQTRPGDWTAVIERLAEELRTLGAGRGFRIRPAAKAPWNSAPCRRA